MKLQWQVDYIRPTPWRGVPKVEGLLSARLITRRSANEMHGVGQQNLRPLNRLNVAENVAQNMSLSPSLMCGPR
jgi:hypothetical protein